QAAGVTVTVNAGDISIGNWTSATRTFTPTTVLPRAVRVITRRDGSANGPISTFLANVIGVTSVNVTAVATAQLNPVSIMSPGEAVAPFGISEFFFNSGFGCGSTIQFAPNVPGNAQTCAGWQAFDVSPPSANNMKDIVDGMTNGTYSAPQGQAGQTYWNFTNGNMASVWAKLVTLWQTKTQNGPWDAHVP